MNLETLQKDKIQAMKNKDNFGKEVLSSVIGRINNEAIAKKCKDNISEDLVIDCIRKEIKVINEQLETCPADRTELLEEFQYKKDFLNMYVPKLIDDPGEIHDLVINLCKDIELSAKNKGLIMRTISTNLKGKVDMKVVQEVVSKLISL